MNDFDRSLRQIDGVSYFVTTCRECGACYSSRTIGKMPAWEAEHSANCPALVAAED